MDSTKLDLARGRAHDALTDLEREASALAAAEPRMWQPGDPEPANAYPYAVHAGAPGDDPWATLCGRRVPRSAIAYHPTMTDCPGCLDKIGPLFLVTVRDAVRAEREACAQICSDEAKRALSDDGPWPGTRAGLSDRLAAAIRARK